MCRSPFISQERKKKPTNSSSSSGSKRERIDYTCMIILVFYISRRLSQEQTFSFFLSNTLFFSLFIYHNTLSYCCCLNSIEAVIDAIDKVSIWRARCPFKRILSAFSIYTSLKICDTQTCLFNRLDFLLLFFFGYPFCWWCTMRAK